MGHAAVLQGIHASGPAGMGQIALPPQCVRSPIGLCETTRHRVKVAVGTGVPAGVMLLCGRGWARSHKREGAAAATAAEARWAASAGL